MSDRPASDIKRYAFNVQDPTRPAQWWFQESPVGTVLFIVFYTKACRWDRCLGCNLSSKSAGTFIDHPDIMAQVDHLFGATPEVAARCNEVRKLILSNNGSMLDEATFPTTALMYLMAQVNRLFPEVACITLETRPEYVDWDELAVLTRLAGEGATPTVVELAIGFEAYDDRIRNDVFQKGMSRECFEDLLAKMAQTGHHLKCYFMQKCVPGMTDAQAVDDIQQAIAYLDACSRKTGVPINMHLNPTYVAYGTPLEPAFMAGTFTPPQLRDVAAAVLAGEGTRVEIVVGLNDEGLAVPGGSFLREGDGPLRDALARFNRDQDYARLRQAL